MPSPNVKTEREGARKEKERKGKGKERKEEGQELGVVLHASNPSIWEAETGGS
jgi:hypothetical protein